MASLSIEITAPELVVALNHLAGALVNATNSAFKVNNPAPVQLPQTPVEQAVRQQVVPAPSPAPAYAPPAVPTAQQPQYAVPPQVYQPTAPVNPIPTAPIQTNRTTGAVNTVPAAAPAPVPPAPIAPSINQAPVAAAPAYQSDDLARAAAQLMDAGKQQDLLNLLAQFKVQALTQLQPEQFGAFATKLRQMGAKL
ncbi:hypothetical protein [Clostridium sp. KNHs216]|uniref:hypothetical protein n=1 Tax=Clostridium sp. KNHs216 TaxID=1550235 RepID=UPI001154F4FE|nr:hypothetical protein [Clostridium sp. KNHs216]TQI66235.1 ribonuclease E [Clostridium sp. KNHs216]